jgi:hypothetical protein
MTNHTRGLALPAAMYAALLIELADRGGDVKESGAFLLAPADAADDADADHVEVTAIAYYDDLDPASLTGAVDFHAAGYTALAATCRRDRVRVVGDIHTHPGRRVGQSTIDAAHPMSALPGHVAVIAPNFARDNPDPTELGVHVYLGNKQWKSYFAEDVQTVLRITGRTVIQRAVRWLRAIPRSIRRPLGQRRSR